MKMGMMFPVGPYVVIISEQLRNHYVEALILTTILRA